MVHVAFAIDTHDREAMVWVATDGGGIMRCRLGVEDSHLGQEAARVEPGQHGGIDGVSLDLGMGDQANLFGVRDDDPPHLRGHHLRERRGVASRLDDHMIVVGQRPRKLLQVITGHADPAQPDHPHKGLRMRSSVSSSAPSLNQPRVRFDESTSTRRPTHHH